MEYAADVVLNDDDDSNESFVLYRYHRSNRHHRAMSLNWEAIHRISPIPREFSLRLTNAVTWPFSFSFHLHADCLDELISASLPDCSSYSSHECKLLSMP